MTSSEIIHKIRGNEQQRAVAVNYLYNNRSLKQAVFRYVSSKKGNEEDALTIFHDVIIQFVKTAFSNLDLVIEGEADAYLMGIAKHLWFAELRKRGKNPTLDLDIQKDLAGVDESISSLLIKRDQRQMLSELLGKLGKNCREILMYWAHGFLMTEIADKMNYLSEGMARKKKSICMKELLLIVQLNPQIKHMLEP